MKNNVTLDKYLIKFLKEEHLYEKYQTCMKQNRLVYENVLRDLIYLYKLKSTYILTLPQLYETCFKTTHFGQGEEITRKWKQFIKDYNIKNYIYYKDDVKEEEQNKNFFNIATTIIKQFLKEQNEEQLVINILQRQNKIKEYQIYDNDLDKICRQTDTKICNFFINHKTIGAFSQFNNQEIDVITNLSNKFIKHCKTNNCGLIVP